MADSIFRSGKPVQMNIYSDHADVLMSRRDVLKVATGGVGLLLAGSTLPSCVNLPKSGKITEFWKKVGEIQANEFIESIIVAAKAQVDYSNALTASERSAALLGSDSGKPLRDEAQQHFSKRTHELENVKKTLAALSNKISDADKVKFDKYLNSRGMDKMMADARRVAIQGLVKSNVQPAMATEAAQNLDKNLAKLTELDTFDGLVKFLDQELDEKIKKQFANPGVIDGICLLILIITSMYVALIIAAVLVLVLVCILTLGYACESVSLEDILNDMIEDICG